MFEKRLIEAYIAEHGKDPTNSEDMSLDDLVALKDSSLVLPRAPDMASSIPQLMKALQTEWETKMVSSFDQIQEVRRLREELAQTKWSYLAAAQTVRRVRIERDEARAALMQVSVGSGKGPAASVSAEDEVKPPIGTVLPAHLFQKVQDTQSMYALSKPLASPEDSLTRTNSLSAGRRKRSVPDDYATVDRVKKVKPAKPSSPLVSAGSTAFAITNSGHVVLAGSLDGGASVYSIRKQKSMYEFSTGKIGVSSVANIDYEEEESNNAALFGLENGIIKMYHGETPVTTIKGHTGPVASLAVHPSHDIAASVGEDQRVVMYDLKNGKGIEKIKDMTISTSESCLLLRQRFQGTDCSSSQRVRVPPGRPLCRGRRRGRKGDDVLDGRDGAAGDVRGWRPRQGHRVLGERHVGGDRAARFQGDPDLGLAQGASIADARIRFGCPQHRV